jgi:hypothetical protein
MITKKQDNSENVLKRIYEKRFKVLRDPQGIALNVSYTDDGLKWTTDSKGKNLYFTKGNYVEDFKPDLNIIREKSFRSKCEKRWIDKANSMLYEQRPFFKEENIKIKSQIVSNGYPNID